VSKQNVGTKIMIDEESHTQNFNTEEEKMIKETYQIKTNSQIEMIDITMQIREFVRKNQIKEGRITVFVPHTTAGVTINENCDPDVQFDLNHAMNKLFPDNLNIRHGEGNSSAHLMSSLTGVTQDIFVENGNLLLGTWQAVYFWEFDGSRVRKYHLIYCQ